MNVSFTAPERRQSDLGKPGLQRSDVTVSQNEIVKQVEGAWSSVERDLFQLRRELGADFNEAPVQVLHFSQKRGRRPPETVNGHSRPGSSNQFG